jgi:solute carrier family 35 (adenosine 3'-phospho 5'-phosphosulfate transporter), member B3
MQYINYPAKTLMKSSRVVFTMLFGVLIQRKVYKTADYAIVIAMVAGLAMFMHADANSSAVFHHMGVIMLTISLVADGAISNMSETIMSQFGVGQDEFIFRLYSISLMAIATAATVQGDLWAGLIWMTQPGTYQQYLDQTPLNERSWSVTGKVLVMILFSTMGFFGSSTSAAITKNFGALTMSITSTARKATTLFLSFLLFNNVCTAEHVAGMAVFIAALTTKSLRRRNGSKKKEKRRRQVKRKQSSSNHHHHHGANNTTTPTIVSIRSHSESTPERLTFRHGRGNSNENIELLSSANGNNSNVNNRMNLVHIV